MLITKVDEARAEVSWRRKPLSYKVNADERAYKTGFVDGYNEAKAKLTKATRVIRNLLHVPELGKNELAQLNAIKAEQFLKEVENDYSHG